MSGDSIAARRRGTVLCCSVVNLSGFVVTCYHITGLNVGPVGRRGYFGQPLCVALVSFNLQGIPRRPVMNPFRPDPDEMALDSLFQTPSTFASSNPSAEPVVPRPK